MVDYEDDEGRPVNIEEFYPLYKKEFSLNRWTNGVQLR
jgi:hypothetical protein